MELDWIKSQSDAWSASRERLDATHAALTGEPFPERVSDAAASVRMTMLILKARDHVEPGTVDVIGAVLRKGIKMENKYKEGTLAAELSAQITPESKPRESIQPPKRRKLERVVAVSAGERMQKGSQRYAVFVAIQNAGDEGITLDALDTAMGFKVSGHVQKLAASGHVVSVDEPESAAPAAEPAQTEE